MSNLLIYCFVSLINYLGSKFFVFRHRGGNIMAVSKFYTLVASSIIFNSIFVWAFTTLFSLPYYVAGIAFLAVWALISFLLQKYWVFQDRR